LISLCLMALGGKWSPAEGELRRWTAGEVEDFRLADLENVQVHPDSLVILAFLDEEKNLALGRSTVNELDRQVPLTDGSIEIGRGEWLSGTPHVFGRNFIVDLGLDRAITRVRILAGESALRQTEYFVRGYRIEAATQNSSNTWRLLAEQAENFLLNIDTRADSTWVVLDATGAPLSRLGRLVRLTLIRQDRSNWVALGEIEVFGTGFAEEGRIAGEWTSPEPVNPGRIRWQVQSPPQTQVEVKFRGTADGGELPEWEELESYRDREQLFAGAEPVDRFQYQAILQTGTPFSTPGLQRLEVDYDPVLVARQVLGEVAPETAQKGAPTALTYTAKVELEPGNYGIDLMRLEGIALTVDELRYNGRSLVYDENLERGFRWRSILNEERTLFELADSERIVDSGRLEIFARALFLQDRTRVELQVGNREQEERDGYVNWQNSRKAPGTTSVVLAVGEPTGLLSEIEVEPSPFSPVERETVDFRFVVGNIREVTGVVLRLFTLDGEPMRRLQQEGRARVYHFEWDGRDCDGRIVKPGLYLYEIQVGAGGDAANRAGTLVVAY